MNNPQRHRGIEKTRRQYTVSSRQKNTNLFILLTAYSLLLTFSVSLWLFLPTLSYAGIRGAPEGKPRVEVGDEAPLEYDELRKAHESGKAIILMFGNPDHCIYCEKVWFNIKELMPQYENDVAFVLVRHRAAKFWGAEDRDRILGERYGAVGEPWLFLIDKEGIVRQIFAGLTGLEQIDIGLKNLVVK